MKKIIFSAVVLLGVLFTIVSCQKEVSYEGGFINNTPSTWEFKRDTAKYAGIFDSVKITKTAGVYLLAFASGPATTNLSESIELQLGGALVSGATYTTTTSNGIAQFYYLKNGVEIYSADPSLLFSVTITGLTDSTISGTFQGKVLGAAFDTITLKEGKFNARTKSTVIVNPTDTTTSAGSLGSNADTCAGVTLTGVYKKNVAMTGSNTATVSVLVTKAGRYVISSDTIKGFYFRATGTFSAAGAQPVVVPAYGYPTDSGTVKFRLTYSGKSCTFVVKVDTSNITTPPVTLDYLPTTTGSNWSYSNANLTGNVSDTFYTFASGSNVTLNGNSYSLFKSTLGSEDSVYYRKSSGIYYSTLNLEDYFSTGGIKEVIILKDNVNVGSTWTDGFSGTSSGISVSVNFDNIISEKAVAATVGALSFPDVIKVTTSVNQKILSQSVPLGNYERWFARGIGLIYQKTTLAGQSVERKLTRSAIF